MWNAITVFLLSRVALYCSTTDQVSSCSSQCKLQMVIYHSREGTGLDALAVENIAQKNAQRNNTPSAIKYNKEQRFSCWLNVTLKSIMDEIRIIHTKLWSILLSFCKVLSFDRGERVTSHEWIGTRLRNWGTSACKKTFHLPLYINCWVILFKDLVRGTRWGLPKVYSFKVCSLSVQSGQLL